MELVRPDLESVRQRPAMYIGGTDSKGLECFAFELIGNAFDEHLAGRSRSLEVLVSDALLRSPSPGGSAPFSCIAHSDHRLAISGRFIATRYRTRRLGSTARGPVT